jgi:hypothetical protein
VFDYVGGRAARTPVDHDGTSIDTARIHHAQPSGAQVVGTTHHGLAVEGDMGKNVTDRPTWKLRRCLHSVVIEISYYRDEML